MKVIGVLAFLLCGLSFLSFLLGMCEPAWVIRWGKPDQKTRKRVFMVFGWATLTLFIVFSVAISDDANKTTPSAAVLTNQAAPAAAPSQATKAESNPQQPAQPVFTVSAQITDKFVMPNIKAQFNVHMSLVGGWLPTLDQLNKITKACMDNQGLDRDSFERVFVSFFLPGMKQGNPFAGYHWEREGNVTKYEYFILNLEDSIYASLILPKSCAHGPGHESVLSQAGAKTKILWKQGMEAVAQGCPDHAVRLFDKALTGNASGSLSKKDRAWAYQQRGVAYCRLAVLQRDRSLFQQAVKDFKQAFALLGPGQQPPLSSWKSYLASAEAAAGEFKQQSTYRQEPSTPAPIHDHRSLTVGTQFTLKKVVNLMPAMNPADHLAAMKQVVKLPIGTSIKVLAIGTKNNSPWYQVVAGDKTGWINSVALIGQFD